MVSLSNPSRLSIRSRGAKTSINENKRFQFELTQTHRVQRSGDTEQDCSTYGSLAISTWMIDLKLIASIASNSHKNQIQALPSNAKGASRIPPDFRITNKKSVLSVLDVKHVLSH